MKTNNLHEGDIAFLKRHETAFLTHQELTTRFLSLVREYPNYKRGDFSSAFGKTLNYMFPKKDCGDKEFPYSTNIREGNDNA